jgi:hypothetical protein
LHEACVGFPALIDGGVLNAYFRFQQHRRLARRLGPVAPRPPHGPEGAEDGPAGLNAAPVKTAKEEFLDYAKMTPAQKMRASMLSKLGVTEEQLKAMDAKERQKIEDKIKEMIKAEIEGPDGDRKPKGMLVDVKA